MGGGTHVGTGIATGVSCIAKAGFGMERVKATDFGVEIIFGGPLSREEAAALIEELDRKLPRAAGPFGVLVDSRRFRAYTAEAQEAFKRGIQLCQERGMHRAAVVLDGAIATLHAKRLGKDTGTLPWTRYIDALSHPDWRRMARAWMLEGTEPETWSGQGG